MNLFERKSDRIDLCLPALREVLWNLVKPITTKEVRHCLTCVRGSQVHLDLTVSLGRRLSNISIQLASLPTLIIGWQPADCLLR